jgi:hypothetical protein
MVGREDHDRVAVEAVRFERCEDLADLPIHERDVAIVARELAPDGRAVGVVGRQDEGIGIGAQLGGGEADCRGPDELQDEVHQAVRPFAKRREGPGFVGRLEVDQAEERLAFGASTPAGPIALGVPRS